MSVVTTYNEKRDELMEALNECLVMAKELVIGDDGCSKESKRCCIIKEELNMNKTNSSTHGITIKRDEHRITVIEFDEPFEFGYMDNATLGEIEKSLVEQVRDRFHSYIKDRMYE